MNLTALTSFVALMLAVSIAAERMVEILKGWMPDSWLFKPKPIPREEAHRAATVQVLAGLCGLVVAAVGNVDLFNTLAIKSWTYADGLGHGLYRAASWSTTGVLASGGSGFWNHTLDLLKATKVQQLQKAGLLSQNPD